MCNSIVLVCNSYNPRRLFTPMKRALSERKTRSSQWEGMRSSGSLDAIHEPALEVTRAMASLHTTNAAASADLQLHEITRFLMLKIPMIHLEIRIGEDYCIENCIEIFGCSWIRKTHASRDTDVIMAFSFRWQMTTTSARETALPGGP